MAEYRLQAHRRPATAGVIHGPRREDVGHAGTHQLLCGECGVILLRIDAQRLHRDIVVLCDNCGALNTDPIYIGGTPVEAAEITDARR